MFAGVQNVVRGAEGECVGQGGEFTALSSLTSKSYATMARCSLVAAISSVSWQC
jgi:hypothetical protein